MYDDMTSLLDVSFNVFDGIIITSYEYISQTTVSVTLLQAGPFGECSECPFYGTSLLSNIYPATFRKRLPPTPHRWKRHTATHIRICLTYDAQDFLIPLQSPDALDTS